MSKELYKSIDLNFDALKDKESGFEDGEEFYSTLSLIKATKEQKSVKEKIYLNSINHRARFKNIGAIEMAEHYKRIEKADIKYPIIINRDGMILDGYHRITKAILLKRERIYGYRINLEKVIPEKNT